MTVDFQAVRPVLKTRLGRLSASDMEAIMSRISAVRMLKSKYTPVTLTIVGLLAVLGSMALAAQNKYTVKVPGGLAFSDFRGYEDWKDVAVSQTETNLKVIVANDVMMKAYRQAPRSRRSSGSRKRTPCPPIS
jgi:hypothetical protein